MSGFAFYILFPIGMGIIGYVISRYLHPTTVMPHTIDALNVIANNVNDIRFHKSLMRSIRNINRDILNAAKNGRKHLSIALEEDVSDRLYLNKALIDKVIGIVNKQIIHIGSFTVEVNRFGFASYTIDITWGSKT